MGRHRSAAIIALTTALVGIVVTAVPSNAALEDTLGLRWLFRTRGLAMAPTNVVIVTIDETVAARLNLPSQLREWPRAIHARLVDRLVDSGATAIAFDITFLDAGVSAEDDRAFSEALKRAKRVVLVQALEVSRYGSSEIAERRDPIPVLANAAQGLAPAPLPALPLVPWLWTTAPRAQRRSGPPAVLPGPWPSYRGVRGAPRRDWRRTIGKRIAGADAGRVDEVHADRPARARQDAHARSALSSIAADLDPPTTSCCESSTRSTRVMTLSI